MAGSELESGRRSSLQYRLGGIDLLGRSWKNGCAVAVGRVDMGNSGEPARLWIGQG
ncbi:MAG: hypothetical protein VB857_00075 [Pirellulaceae bacterium]